ncbi:MFS transporter [Nocardia carnea]|uniref:MFS transporter n=1 Tax=Nocardia carnea TaxID=37328 RepID=A0ABW7TR79_9NOCA|nr:MFS transporter [Nocardia carnea]
MVSIRQRDTTPAQPPAEVVSTARSGTGIVVVLAACGYLMALQQTMVLPLLPALPSLLNTSASNASWLVTATLVTGAVVTPLIGRLADMFGKKRLIVLTLILVIAASILGALSDALLPLILARAVQGCGLALIPVAMATMSDVLPAHRVPGGVATMSASMAIGAAAGLPLSGLIVTFLDWHWIFWAVALAGSVLLPVVMKVVPPAPARPRERFDILGAVVLAGALTALLVPLSKGGQWGWSSPATLLSAGTSVLLFAGWIPLQLRSRTPLVNLRVAARPPLLFVNLCALLIGFALFSNILLTTQLLQLPAATGFGAGLSVLEAGFWLMPIALVGIATAPIAARAIGRFGPQPVLLVAAIELALAFTFRVPFSREPWQMLVGAVVVGIGLSLTIAAVPTLIMTLVPISQSASATSISALLQSVGTSTASATMAAVGSTWTITAGGAQYPGETAFAAMFWIAAATTAAAAVLAGLLIAGRRARQTVTSPARE